MRSWLAKGIVGSIFTLSLAMMVFSFFQIGSAEYQIQATLEEWEQESEASISEAPLLDTPTPTAPIPVAAVPAATPLYPKRPNQGEVIGKLEIPTLNQVFPVLEGTDQEELAKGVGHYIGSVLPGESDNTVLAGHRDTVFRELGEVSVGDMLNVQTSAGDFSYQVVEQRIVDKEDRSIIVSHPEPILTVVTCYPFDYVGPAPKRYILTAKLVEAAQGE